MSSVTLAGGLCALAVVSALVAGGLQTFSDFVMRALAQLEDSAGMYAMQRINVTVLRSLFLACFFFLVPALAVAVWLTVVAAVQVGYLVLAAAGVYLVGVVAVTARKNVPMNEKLDRLVRSGNRAEAARYWELYVAHWTRWNHVRVIAGIATSILLLSGVVLLP